jgi:hypothetical protein
MNCCCEPLTGPQAFGMFIVLLVIVGLIAIWMRFGP